MAKIVVTGGAGFIGSNLTKALLARGDSVVVIDNFNDFYDPAIKKANTAAFTNHPKCKIHNADIRDRGLMEEILADFDPDAIMHLAAWAGVRPSLEKPEVYVDNNLNGTTSLFEAARHHPNCKFVMASSSSVYGGGKEVPFKESADVNKPISVYAATKRACEVMAHAYHHLYGMNVWCLRFFTCYGPSQRPDLAIHKFTQMIEDGEALPMFGDGSSCRDYLYIDDCVRGVISAIDRCSGYEIVNLGESRTVRLDELIGLLGKLLGKTPIIEHLPDQLGDVPQTWADLTKAKALLDYDPGTMIEEGLARFVEWYRSKA